MRFDDQMREAVERDLRSARFLDKITYGAVGFIIGAVLCLVIGALA